MFKCHREMTLYDSDFMRLNWKDETSKKWEILKNISEIRNDTGIFGGKFIRMAGRVIVANVYSFINYKVRIVKSSKKNKVRRRRRRKREIVEQTYGACKFNCVRTMRVSIECEFDLLADWKKQCKNETKQRRITKNKIRPIVGVRRIDVVLFWICEKKDIDLGYFNITVSCVEFRDFWISQFVFVIFHSFRSHFVLIDFHVALRAIRDSVHQMKVNNVTSLSSFISCKFFISIFIFDAQNSVERSNFEFWHIFRRFFHSTLISGKIVRNVKMFDKKTIISVHIFCCHLTLKYSVDHFQILL